MKYRPEVTEQLFELISTGVSVTGACQSVGISKTTYYRWKERYEKFRGRTERALAMSEVTWITGLNQILENENTSSAIKVNIIKYLLSRRFPDQWGSNRGKKNGGNSLKKSNFEDGEFINSIQVQLKKIGASS